MKITPALLTLSAALAGGPAITAQSLVSYSTFPSNGDEASVAGVTTQAGITGLDLTRGGGLTPNVGGNSFNSAGWATNAEGETTVLNTEGFVQLGFVVEDGFVATLDELLFASEASGSGPDQIGVFTSQDDFTTEIAVIDDNFGGFLNNRVDLSGLADVTGEFTIRFQILDATTSDPDRAGELDNESTWRISTFFDGGFVTDTPGITGTVSAVPEPASLAVLGLGSVVLMGRRRQGA